MWGPKSNDQCPSKRHTQGRRPSEDTRGDWSDVATSPEPPDATRGWKRQEGFSLRAFEGSVALPIPSFGLTNLLNQEKIHFCYFKPRGCPLVTAALGYEWGVPSVSAVKDPPDNAGDLGSRPESGRSSGGGNGNPLQYSYLENPMDRGAWRATVHGVQRVRHD